MYSALVIGGKSKQWRTTDSRIGNINNPTNGRNRRYDHQFGVGIPRRVFRVINLGEADPESGDMDWTPAKACVGYGCLGQHDRRRHAESKHDAENERDRA